MRPQVAYLEPERVEMPLAVRLVLRDARARLGGAQEVLLLRPATPGGPLFVLLDRHGKGPGDAPMPRSVNTIVRQARLAGQMLYAACRDLGVLQQGGPEPESSAALSLEVHAWRLEGLVWQQRQQRRCREEGGVGGGWERRGGAGRRGRRRREPGVVFELGAWGEARRAVSHEGAAWVLMEAVRLA